MDFAQDGKPAAASVIRAPGTTTASRVSISYHRRSGQRLYTATAEGSDSHSKGGSYIQVIDCLQSGKTDRPALRVEDTRIGVLEASHHEDCILWAGDATTTDSADRHTVSYHSVYDNKILRRFRGHAGSVQSLSQCPADDTFLSAATDQTVRLWTLQSAGCLAECKLPGQISPATPPLAVFDGSGLVFGISAQKQDYSGHYLHLYDARNYQAGAFAEWIVPTDAVTKALETAGATSTEASTTAKAPWRSLLFNAAGNQILVTGGQGLCLLLDGFEGSVQSALVHPSSSATVTACFASDDKHVISAIGGDSENASTNNKHAGIFVWNVATKQKIRTLPAGHTAPVTCLAANPVYAQLASSSVRETALWSWS